MMDVLRPPAVGHQVSGNRCVLIVDDDTSLARLMADILVDAGYTAQVAPSPAMAEGTFDLVIADYLCPSFAPGAPWPFLERLRALSAGPILGCTGHHEALQDPPEELGISAVLTKPFDVDELVSEVHRLTRGELHCGRTAATGAAEADRLGQSGVATEWYAHHPA